MKAPTQQANIMEEQESSVKGLPSVSTEKKSLKWSIKRKSEKRGLIKWVQITNLQMKTEEPPSRKGRFELMENYSKLSWYLEKSMFRNKYFKMK